MPMISVINRSPVCCKLITVAPFVPSAWLIISFQWLPVISKFSQCWESKQLRCCCWNPMQYDNHAANAAENTSGIILRLCWRWSSVICFSNLDFPVFIHSISCAGKCKRSLYIGLASVQEHTHTHTHTHTHSSNTDIYMRRGRWMGYCHCFIEILLS